MWAGLERPVGARASRAFAVIIWPRDQTRPMSDGWWDECITGLAPEEVARDFRSVGEGLEGAGTNEDKVDAGEIISSWGRHQQRGTNVATNSWVTYIGLIYQIDIQRPPKQRYEQHYGYRVNRKYMLYLESKIKTDPNAFYNSMSLYCIDPERHDEVECDEDLHRFEEDEEDEFVILVLSVCSG
ncbi:uncharacterized protein EDB91DRAFT_1078356 [Suillus paluster]|uniref:uncharacterized protein n=1 Tax=Suillus paluster TaxID=48578 RepID=UPI001B86E95D|nr:uncharacterized protein EDB91DRAFT_1078356 [Suillus paluster]KAG1751616.1 hypothetical protein EDB91DRAFT_1078356 [Suillus paluster]